MPLEYLNTLEYSLERYEEWRARCGSSHFITSAEAHEAIDLYKLWARQQLDEGDDMAYGGFFSKTTLLAILDNSDTMTVTFGMREKGSYTGSGPQLRPVLIAGTGSDVSAKVGVPSGYWSDVDIPVLDPSLDSTITMDGGEASLTLATELFSFQDYAYDLDSTRKRVWQFRSGELLDDIRLSNIAGAGFFLGLDASNNLHVIIITYTTNGTEHAFMQRGFPPTGFGTVSWEYIGPLEAIWLWALGYGWQEGKRHILVLSAVTVWGERPAKP